MVSASKKYSLQKKLKRQVGQIKKCCPLLRLRTGDDSITTQINSAHFFGVIMAWRDHSVFLSCHSKEKRIIFGSQNWLEVSNE